MTLYPKAALCVEHVSNKATRPGQMGVRFRADGSVEATDGHILARFTPDEGPKPSREVTIAAPGGLLKLCRKKADILELEPDDEGALASCGGETLRATPVEGYPETDQVWEGVTSPVGFTVAIHLDVLETIVKVAKTALINTSTRRSVLKIHQKPGDPLAAIVVRAEADEGSLEIAAMPVRAEAAK